MRLKLSRLGPYIPFAWIIITSLMGCTENTTKDGELEEGDFFLLNRPLGKFLDYQFQAKKSLSNGYSFLMIFEYGESRCEVDTTKTNDNLSCYYPNGNIFLQGTWIDSTLEGELIQFDYEGNLDHITNFVHGAKLGGVSIFNGADFFLEYAFSDLESGIIFHLERDESSRTGYSMKLQDTLTLPVVINSDLESPYKLNSTHTLNLWSPCPPGFKRDIYICEDYSFSNCKKLSPHNLYKDICIYTISSEVPGTKPLYFGYHLTTDRGFSLVKGITQFDATFE